MSEKEKIIDILNRIDAEYDELYDGSIAIYGAETDEGEYRNLIIRFGPRDSVIKIS